MHRGGAKMKNAIKRLVCPQCMSFRGVHDSRIFASGMSNNNMKMTRSSSLASLKFTIYDFFTRNQMCVNGELYDEKNANVLVIHSRILLLNNDI